MIVDREDLEQLLLGAAFFSTGGGGSLAAGVELVASISKLEIVRVGEARPGGISATGYLVGSIDAPSLGEVASRGIRVAVKREAELVVRAFQFLREKWAGAIDYVVPVELGGYNTAVALFLAFETGLPLLDADLTGRSAPEMYQTGYYIGDIPPTPAAVVTAMGEKLLIEGVSDYGRLDNLLRALVQATHGLDVGVANFPVAVSTAGPFLVQGSLSKCMRIGALLSQGRVEEAVSLASGHVIYRGRVTGESFHSASGFTVGHALVTDGKTTLSLRYKNEILAAYLGQELAASVPDLIGVVTPGGRPVENTRFPLGEEVIVYVLPAPEIWRTPRGSEVFSLQHFQGLEYERSSDAGDEDPRSRSDARSDAGE